MKPAARWTLKMLTPLLAAAAGSCATTTLSPASTAMTQPGAANVAVSSLDGVRVTAQADAWKGDPGVGRAVQPVRITINNEGSEALRIRYSDFALIAPDGHRYSALPPFAVEGDITSPLLPRGFAPIRSPGFGYRRFFLAPYYAPLYPGLATWNWPYSFYDPWYYPFYHQVLMDAVRPTAEMLGLALPEGVVEPHGMLSGFLYFQKVGTDTPRVTFRWDLISVEQESGRALGEISIPFDVKHDARADR
ncbi:MAG: hypothetical protein R3E10_14935 [Gemmatimonadota bacterium]